MSDRLAPTTTPDTKFFWDALKDGKLLIQRCGGCATLRHPPRPMCPRCNSLAWNTIESSGRGTVYSFVLPRHPPWPWFEGTYVVALIELEEGTRIVSNVCDAVKRVEAPRAAADTAALVDPLGKFFAAKNRGIDKTITIETDLFIAEITTKGGLIKRWQLKKYTTWDGKPLELVDYNHGGDLTLLFATSDGRLINTHDLYFDLGALESDRRVLMGSDEYTVNLSLKATNGGTITKALHFKNGEYGFAADIAFQNMNAVVSNFEYQLVWESGLRYAEHNSVDESSFTGAYAYAGKELTEIDAAELEKRPETNLSGTVDWVANHAGAGRAAGSPGSRQCQFIKCRKLHLQRFKRLPDYLHEQGCCLCRTGWKYSRRAGRTGCHECLRPGARKA